MYKIIFLLLFIGSTQWCHAQSAAIDKTIEKIDFKQDTIQAVFDWVTDNIKYDVAKAKKNLKRKPVELSKYGGAEGYQAHLVKEVVSSKKGVCQDYALLFDGIVKKLGYQSFRVSGYTKDSKGKLNRDVGHVWNAVSVNGKWKLYDTTWGAGQVKNGKKFVKKYSPRWYDVDPKEMMKTHMPNDPIWQLSSAPVTYREFEKNTMDLTVQGDYDYDGMIAEFMAKGKKEQMIDQLQRSKDLGPGMRLINKWRKWLSNSIGVYDVTSQKDVLNGATANSMKAVDLYNEYIDEKNKHSRGKSWSIDKATEKLQGAQDAAQAGIEVYRSIDVDDKKASNRLKKSIRRSEKLLAQIKKEFAYIASVKGK